MGYMGKQQNRRRHSLTMTNTKLKMYGCITMLFYTIGVSVVQNGMIHITEYDNVLFAKLLSENPDMMVLSGWATLLQLIGGLAVPVFAFLLVEGFVHTSSFRRYFLTMLLFAIISEVPYDLAVSDTLWNPSKQNALFSMLLCLIMLYGLRYLKGKTGIGTKIAAAGLIVAALIWSNLFKCDFGLSMILLCAVYYLLYDRNGVKVLMGCAISTLYVTGPLSTYAIWNYNGERGWNKNKYVFYAFYPLHLLVLGVIAHLMQM